MLAITWSSLAYLHGRGRRRDQAENRRLGCRYSLARQTIVAWHLYGPSASSGSFDTFRTSLLVVYRFSGLKLGLDVFSQTVH